MRTLKLYYRLRGRSFAVTVEAYGPIVADRARWLLADKIGPDADLIDWQILG